MAVEEEELVDTEPSMENETLNYETPLIDIHVTGETRNVCLPNNMVVELSPMTYHYQLNSVVPSFRYTRECVRSGLGRKRIRSDIEIFTIISCVEYANFKVNIRYSNTSTLKGKQILV